MNTYSPPDMYSHNAARQQATHDVYLITSGSGPSLAKGHTNPALRSTSSSPGAMLSPGRSRRRTHSSNQGSRSGSPMSTQSVPIESTFGQATHTVPVYHSDGGLTPPHQTSGHSRSSSMSSVKSGLMRDRSLDRADYMLAGAALRDRSLDRALDQMYERPARRRTRDRSLDRMDYPVMGARSLDRAFGGGPLVRSRSIDHEYLADRAAGISAAGFPGGLHGLYAVAQPRDPILARDNLILDLQQQIAEINKECVITSQELDATREKLSSSMNSIKTFWSPELKKERVMRKDEMNKYAMLNEQLRAAQAENQVSFCNREIHIYLQKNHEIFFSFVTQK